MGRGRSATTTALMEAALFTRGLIPSMEKRDTNKVSTLLDAAPLSANPGAD